MRPSVVFAALCLCLVALNAFAVAAEDEEFDLHGDKPVMIQQVKKAESDDWDEFVVSPGAPAPQRAPNPKVIPTASSSDKGQADSVNKAASASLFGSLLSFIPLPAPLKGFEMEVVFVFFLAVYAVNYFVGAAQNGLIAEAWGKSVKGVFEEQFAKVGGETLIKKESANAFKFSATGRRNCIGAEIQLNLNRRQDLLSMAYGYFWGGFAPDTVTIDIALEQDGSVDPMSILIAPKTTILGLRASESYKDVKLLSNKDKERDLAGLGEVFTAFSDSFESVDELLRPTFRQTIAKHGADLRLIHITDKNPRHPKFLYSIRVELKLPAIANLDRLIPLYQLSCDLIDAVVNVKLTNSTKSKVLAKREEAERKSEAAKERRAEEQEKIAEAKRKAEKARLLAMSPEERAKEEERMRKRKMRKQTGKMKIVLK